MRCHHYSRIPMTLKRKKTMAKIRHLKDIKYLVFQGGGGKGVAYSGVLKALEEKGLLPLIPGEENGIKGIAGTSAGAITALLVALGYNSKEINDNFLTKPEIFDAFFDGPDSGSYRTVSSFNRPGKSNRSVNIDLNETVEDFIKSSRDLSLDNPMIRSIAVSLLGFLQSNTQYQSLLKEPAHEVFFMLIKGFDTTHHTNALIGKLGGSILKNIGIEFLLAQIIKKFFPETNNKELYALIERLKTDLYGFAYNLVFDRGVFPGFSVRCFFQKTIASRMNSLFDKRFDGGTLNFKTFYEYTNCNLIFTGVNILKSNFQYFSKDHTPDFPVAEAAAISMNLPFAFKPVYVEGGDLEGLWVDGGTVNNLPLHAFDYIEKKELLKRYHEELYAYLNPNTLAFSLIPPTEQEDKKEKSWKDELPIIDFSANLFDKMWDPNESQIKREVERDQIIQIPYGNLSTMNFTPSDDIKEDPIQNAYNLVMDYLS